MKAAMTTTDGAVAERLAALEARRHPRNGTHRRPAEASRVLAAGAGAAAVLTMVTAMAQADQVVEVVDGPVFEAPAPAALPTFDPGVTRPYVVGEASAEQQPVIQTITVARPVQAQVTNARTSASR